VGVGTPASNKVPNEHESLTKAMEEKTFVVADYQRPYAWTEEQLSDLWGDRDLLGTGEHYAGTLVLRETVSRRSPQRVSRHCRRSP
jgi:hypothetical protein